MLSHKLAHHTDNCEVGAPLRLGASGHPAVTVLHMRLPVTSGDAAERATIAHFVCTALLIGSIPSACCKSPNRCAVSSHCALSRDPEMAGYAMPRNALAGRDQDKGVYPPPGRDFRPMRAGELGEEISGCRHLAEILDDNLLGALES